MLTLQVAMILALRRHTVAKSQRDIAALQCRHFCVATMPTCLRRYSADVATLQCRLCDAAVSHYQHVRRRNLGNVYWRPTMNEPTDDKYDVPRYRDNNRSWRDGPISGQTAVIT